jgi:hypothetical protein
MLLLPIFIEGGERIILELPMCPFLGAQFLCIRKYMGIFVLCVFGWREILLEEQSFGNATNC